MANSAVTVGLNGGQVTDKVWRHSHKPLTHLSLNRSSPWGGHLIENVLDIGFRNRTLEELQGTCSYALRAICCPRAGGGADSKKSGCLAYRITHPADSFKRVKNFLQWAYKAVQRVHNITTTEKQVYRLLQIMLTLP